MFRKKDARRGDVHPVDEVLSPGPMFLYGLQHVLSMYAGVVAVPLIVGTALELSAQQVTYLLSAGLFISGLATLLQTLGLWRLGARLPIVQGTSFAAVATMLAIGAPIGGEAGLRAIFGALIVAGAIAFAVAPFFTRLLRFFPPVVTGTVITVIGVSLLPVAVRWAGGGAPTAPTFGSVRNIGLAGATLVINRADLPVPARVLQPGRDPARAGPRHPGRHPVRGDRLRADR